MMPDTHRDGGKDLHVWPPQPETPAAPETASIPKSTPDLSPWKGEGVGPKLIVTTLYVPPERR